MRNATYRLTALSLLPSESSPSFRYWIGFFAVLALIGFCAWLQPELHGPAALALGAALILDLGARLLAGRVARVTGLGGPVLALPSLALMIGNPVGIALAGFAGIFALGTNYFPVLASLLAGILAMTAIARLALARSLVVSAQKEADEES